MRLFRKNLNLIKVVDQNYDHIQDLETLVSLFKGGLSGYFKQYYPVYEEVTLYCGVIARY